MLFESHFYTWLLFGQTVHKAQLLLRSYLFASPSRALALNCDAALNDKDGAESKNWRAGKPVRVVRSSKGRRISKYAPEDGNRYDGIYKVFTPMRFAALMSLLNELPVFST